LSLESEKKLIAKAKEGDNRAFDELVSHYLEKSFSVAYRYTNTEEDAKDMIQETLLKVFKNIHRFNEKYPFSSWYFKILINNCINFLKKVKIKRKSENIMLQDSDFHNENDTDSLSPENGFIKREKTLIIREGLQHINEKQRSALILHDIEGFTQEETAEILGCPVGSVMSRLYYGRKKLKKILKQKYGF